MDTRIHSSLCGIKRLEYHVYSSKRSGSSIIFASQVRRVFEEGAHSKIERDEEICPLDLKDIRYSKAAPFNFSATNAALIRGGWRSFE